MKRNHRIRAAIYHQYLDGPVLDLWTVGKQRRTTRNPRVIKGLLAAISNRATTGPIQFYYDGWSIDGLNSK